MKTNSLENIHGVCWEASSKSRRDEIAFVLFTHYSLCSAAREPQQV